MHTSKLVKSFTSAIALYSSAMKLKLSLRVPTNMFLEKKTAASEYFKNLLAVIML
jgi:hypothetical protein